jgi:very-short-patch-repair endonuclease
MSGRERTPDVACAEIAESQKGVIHRAQALAAGMTEAQIAGRLGRGEWVQLHPDTYRVAGAPMTPEMRSMAAFVWAGDCFLSHVSAGRLWELDGLPDQDEIELTAYAGKKQPGVIVHRLHPHDRPPVRMIGGMAVASIERTLFELAAKLPLFRAGLALDDALRRQLTTLDRCWQAWESFGRKGRKGTRAFKTLLFVRDDREGLLRSRLEKKMLLILNQIEPLATPNFRVSDHSRTAYLDFAYPFSRLGIETHGAQWHHGEERWKKDLRRDRWLKSLGWTILYFSWDDVHLSSGDVREEIQTFLKRLSVAG